MRTVEDWLQQYSNLDPRVFQLPTPKGEREERVFLLLLSPPPPPPLWQPRSQGLLRFQDGGVDPGNEVAPLNWGDERTWERGCSWRILNFVCLIHSESQKCRDVISGKRYCCSIDGKSCLAEVLPFPHFNFVKTLFGLRANKYGARDSAIVQKKRA